MYQFKYLFVLFICWVIALLCVPFQVFLYFCMWCVITSVICDICQRHIFLNSPQCIWHVRLVFFQINQFSSLQIAILLILKNIHHLLFNMLTYHYISHDLHVLGCLYSSCDITSGPMLSPVTPVTPCDTLWSSVGALSASQTNQKLASYSSAKYLWFMTGATGLQQGTTGCHRGHRG